MAELPEVDIEFEGTETTQRRAAPTPDTRHRFLGYVLVAALALLAGGWLLAGPAADQESEPLAAPQAEGAGRTFPPASSDESRQNAVDISRSLPPSLLAAELYAAEPGPERLRDLLASIGGLEGAQVAMAQGAFDVVGFDPRDPDHLLAAFRSSYGEAQNQASTQEWVVDGGGVSQTLWAPESEHDFVHFNGDGTVTMWVHGGGPAFAPRRAIVLSGADVRGSTEPLYASRSTTSSGVVFALTGNGDYYTNEQGYVDLIADDGRDQRVLASGSLYGWIDNPAPDLVVAYPTTSEGVTAVWDSQTLERLVDHPLANRSYQRLAVSGDRQKAVGITFDGELEEIELPTGRVLSRFGFVDPSGIERPVTLNDDGSLAVTVSRDGLVAMWWVGDEDSIFIADAPTNPLRWVSERYAPRSSSAVALDASRIALKVPARPGMEAGWSIVDTSVDSWLKNACAMSGRPMRAAERAALGLAGLPAACT